MNDFTHERLIEPHQVWQYLSSRAAMLTQQRKEEGINLDSDQAMGMVLEQCERDFTEYDVKLSEWYHDTQHSAAECN